MDRILVPATGHGRWTRAVADAVDDVEDDEQTEAVVLYGFTEDDVESTVSNLDVEDEQPPLDELAGRKSPVSDAVELLEDRGIDCSIRGVEASDDGGSHVLTIAGEENVDRIYMFSRKRSPAGKAIFGSALQDVLLNSPVPVVVVPSTLA